MVATAAWCSRVLALSRYDLALNIGVCGSFDPALKPGDVVHVVTDRIAELGAEDGETFLSMAELESAWQDRDVSKNDPRRRPTRRWAGFPPSAESP